MSKIPKVVRDQFEDYAYRNYEASRLAAALASRDKMRAKFTREEYTKRDAKDEYENPAVAVMFIGWKLCLDALTPTLEAAQNWALWVGIQERVAQELPEHYTIVMGLEKEDPANNSGFYIELLNIPPDSISHSEVSGTLTLKLPSTSIDYPDPVDMVSPGLFARTVESALEAAKAHHAKGLN